MPARPSASRSIDVATGSPPLSTEKNWILASGAMSAPRASGEKNRARPTGSGYPAAIALAHALPSLPAPTRAHAQPAGSAVSPIASMSTAIAGIAPSSANPIASSVCAASAVTPSVKRTMAGRPDSRSGPAAACVAAGSFG